VAQSPARPLACMETPREGRSFPRGILQGCNLEFNPPDIARV